MEIDIYEGARGTGKSTLAFKMRQKTSPTPTLINFTGFHEDGEIGLSKVTDYYKSFMKMLYNLVDHDSQYVFDRFYFSEMVYSRFYKHYEFSFAYDRFNTLLLSLSEMGVKINIYFLTINDEEELKQRLIRDKVPFGKAEESVEQTRIQQDRYTYLFNDLAIKSKDYSNFNIYTIETDGKTSDYIYNEVLTLKTT